MGIKEEVERLSRQEKELAEKEKIAKTQEISSAKETLLQLVNPFFYKLRASGASEVLRELNEALVGSPKEHYSAAFRTPHYTYLCFDQQHWITEGSDPKLTTNVKEALRVSSELFWNNREGQSDPTDEYSGYCFFKGLTFTLSFSQGKYLLELIDSSSDGRGGTVGHKLITSFPEDKWSKELLRKAVAQAYVNLTHKS